MNVHLQRSFMLIEILAERGLLTINMAAELTQIPRSTIFKIFSNLEEMGYVSRKKQSGQTDHWFLTPKLLGVTGRILAGFDLRERVKPILERLSRDVGEIVQLGVLHGSKVMYIDVVRQQTSLIAFAGIGTELDINLSAAGRVLAAAMEKEELDRFLNTSMFKRNTEYTIADPSKLRDDIEQVALKGFAFDDQQWAIGVRCLAAPVFSSEGKVVGAINITGHVSTMSDNRIEALIGKVIEAAREASAAMGYEPLQSNQFVPGEQRKGGGDDATNLSTRMTH
jgi:DNA-binding IclR family transcriptional regulator